MTTVQEIIDGAMRLAGVIADGETLTAKEAMDALTSVNQMIDSWALEGILLYDLDVQILTWPANTDQVTVGPTGTLVGYRPLDVSAATFFRDTTKNIRYTPRIVGEKEFYSVAYPNVTATFPEMMYVNYNFPNAELNIFPKLTLTKELNLFSRRELTQPANLTTVLSFPQGYAQAFRFNLATLLAPEYGVPVSNDILRVAVDTKEKIRRLNQSNNELKSPIGSGLRYNIYSDNYQ
jgi:hypothetical protein